MRYNAKDFPLCNMEINRINNKFVENGWITLFENRVFAVMVSDEVLDTAMKDDSWELNAANARPYINEDKNTAWGYSRYYNEGVEPVVVVQEEKCHHKQSVRLCEEMILFYDLRVVTKNDGNYDYVMVDEVGDDVLVARYEAGTLVALVKYIKEFIAVKGMNLLVQFDENHYDSQSLISKGLVPLDFTVYCDNDSVFGYALNDTHGNVPGWSSFAWIRGKVCFRHNDLDIKLLWNCHEEGYEDFIVGMDENGDEIKSTCEEKKLPNAFTWDGEGVYTLTPVFFKREVLEKFYNDTVKYTVQDGYITGPEWGAHADTDRCDNYTVLTLVDLGRMPYKEQQYWRRFNVVPPKGAKLSDTTLQRWFDGQPSDTKNAPDFIFKHVYTSLNKVWESHYGWPLFKPLADGDKYHFESLHVMTCRDNDNEFYGLLQSLTLLVVDSLNEGEIWKNVDQNNADFLAFLNEKGITDLSKLAGIKKFELFLVCQGMRNDDLISLWRDIQDLRSTNVAHRKSSKPDVKQKALLSRFGLDKQSQQEVFSQILIKVVEKMIWLKEQIV
ncbi:MAG: hypothetical protein IJR04_02170 [Bacteroidales bacterium]|nr:hypothetical protein [Bacteroidales bacterium]